MIKPFAQCSILVIGDAMLDRNWHGDSKRISPEVPVPVLKVEQTQNHPGGAANLCLNLIALGAASTLCGYCGGDDAGQELKSQLKALNIADALHTSNTGTHLKLRLYSQNQQQIRLDFPHRFDDEDPQDLLAALNPLWQKHQAVVLSDYDKGTLNAAQLFIQAAKSHDLPVIAGVHHSHFERYRHVALLICNHARLNEAALAIGVSGDWTACAKALCEHYDIQSIVVSLGRSGLAYVNQQGTTHLQPAFLKDVYDITGVADTVVASLALFHVTGASWPSTLYHTALAASEQVKKLGTQPVTFLELNDAKHKAQAALQLSFGMHDLDEMRTLVQQAKDRGERIVFTNGCFDVMHSGHVKYLQEARALGDRLIVGLNDDASITRLKGENRPINPLNERAQALSALSCVDYVLPFTEDTPIPTLQALAPNILVKGGDYQEHEIVGHEVVKEQGGDVIALSLHDDGLSTTSILQAIAALGD